MNSLPVARRTPFQWLADLDANAIVWCDFARQEARTADGFCEFCGATDHRPTATKK